MFSSDAVLAGSLPFWDVSHLSWLLRQQRDHWAFKSAPTLYCAEPTHYPTGESRKGPIPRLAARERIESWYAASIHLDRHRVSLALDRPWRFAEVRRTQTSRTACNVRRSLAVEVGDQHQSLARDFRVSIRSIGMWPQIGCGMPPSGLESM